MSFNIPKIKFILSLFTSFLFLSSCGVKGPPQVPEGSEIPSLINYYTREPDLKGEAEKFHKIKKEMLDYWTEIGQNDQALRVVEPNESEHLTDAQKGKVQEYCQSLTNSIKKFEQLKIEFQKSIHSLQMSQEEKKVRREKIIEEVYEQPFYYDLKFPFVFPRYCPNPPPLSSIHFISQ